MTGTSALLAPQGDVLWAREAALPTGAIDPVPETADVVVVGSGFTGTCAARELALRGRDVVVLEQAELGFGASTRNAGFAHAGVRRSLPELRRRFGDVLGRELYRDTVAALEHVEELVESIGIACDFEHRGYLYLAERRRQAERLRGAQAALADAGHVSLLLAPDEVAAQTGTTGYAAGLLLEGAAALHPARFLEGLVRDAVQRGARFSDRTRVTALDEEPGAGVVVTTDRGRIRARHVLVATDGYTGDLLPFLRQRVIPIDSFILATAPLDDGLRGLVSPRGHLCLETKNFLRYWRLSTDGRLVFGGRASFAPTSIERAAAWLETQLRRVFPCLDGVAIEAVWGGKTGFSYDQLPHVGRLGEITYAVTYCGGGVALATWFGTSAARWIDGGPPPPFARIPFPKVPLFNGRPWFLPLVGPVFALQDAVR